MSNNKWGFLRETKELAQKAGIDPDTGLHRNGLEEYLCVIFPNTTDWIHNKVIEGSGSKKRPDYRSESLKLIVEFDGAQHYTEHAALKNDLKGIDIYEKMGYKVVRIPFFIQLTNKVVKQLFGIDIQEELFDESFPSLGPHGITPAMVCATGIVRMAKEVRNFPEQYEVNLRYLKSFNDEYLTGAKLLEMLYNSKEI